MVTFALGTTPPEGSETVPTRVARSRCASRAHAERRASTEPRSTAFERYILPLTSCQVGRDSLREIIIGRALQASEIVASAQDDCSRVREVWPLSAGPGPAPADVAAFHGSIGGLYWSGDTRGRIGVLARRRVAGSAGLC